jgi:Leucine-rich repeat (LRR) protein
MEKILTLLIVIAMASHIINCKEAPKKCQVDRVHKMIAYDCTDLKLSEIPKNLKTSVEVNLIGIRRFFCSLPVYSFQVLDASLNRIKKLNKKSFGSYTKLKHLYLCSNRITKIEKGTFAELESLETLDLSDNTFREVPAEIMDLPRLRKLSMVEIELTNSGFSKIKKPVKAPLVYLNIAETEIDEIPDFGILPSLKVLNISRNSLARLKPEQFAPLCRIEIVDISESEVNPCQCASINFFLENELGKNPILNCEKPPKG